MPVVHSGSVLTVPPVVVTLEGVADEMEDAPGAALSPEAPVAPLPLFGGAASTNADAGSPPTVSASAAFNARKAR